MAYPVEAIYRLKYLQIERLPSFSGNHAARGSVEQANAYNSFKAGQLLAERRLGDSALSGGIGNATSSVDRCKGA